MAKMPESDLLAYLNSEADSAYQFMSGDNARDRTRAMREYLRLPYGNEEEGRSNVVASDVFDSVEGMLPDLIEVFVSTDEAVRFDPVGPEDEEGAKQATNACNYVFYKQNNGFHILYTAAKDALMLKTGAVKWYWEEKRTPSFTTYRDVSEDALAMFVMQNPEAEILGRTGQEPEEGKPPGLFTVKVKTVETKGKCKVVPIPPDELRVSRLHNSVLLDECPYVAHVCRRTKSQILQMGFSVSDEDIKAAESEETTTDRELRDILRDDYMRAKPDAQDPSQIEGYLREEYVLVDFDGDGIAERRRIIRLGQKVLENEECSHVQIAGWTPYILTHRFDGLSVADLTSDFQRIQTELIRQSLDNVALANNNETIVFSPLNGAPMANIDDLLNRRAGGIIREHVQGAVRPYNEHLKAIDAFPLVEMIDTKKENRTGFTRYSQGLDSNSLNKTAHGLQQIMNASQKRQKLMARIMAEALVAPMFRGIFKTLTDYCMDKLAFRLNGQFIQYDPQEWRDGYDMTINVGIGAGDKMQQLQMLGSIEMAQASAVQAGGLGKVVTLPNLYNLQKRKVELAGFKDPGEFWTDPETVQAPPPAPPPPDPKMQIEGAKLQQDGQKFQATQQADATRMQIELQFKADEAERARQHELRMKAIDMQWADSQRLASIPPPEEPKEAGDEDVTANQMAAMLNQSVQMIAEKVDSSKPVAVEKIRDAQGRMVGARITQMDGSIREVPIQ